MIFHGFATISIIFQKLGKHLLHFLCYRINTNQENTRVENGEHLFILVIIFTLSQNYPMYHLYYIAIKPDSSK